MQVHVGPCMVELVSGDITQQSTDAIVNAANSRLAGGGGVDGAIHRRGGTAIMIETRQKYPQGCPTGEAVITGAGALPARYVIHAVGPVWRGGQQQEAVYLASAYHHSLRLAVAQQCHSVAFPSLSTGAYGYPVAQAAQTALRTVLDFVRQQRQPAQVRFVLFDQQTHAIYTTVLQQLLEAELAP
ncbi:MAG: O-acetyl-ADP-ribose deacetylase [Candidatus Tectimicrobiota bacterium]